ncbi:MAG: terpene cyclase/mutase family protein [Anaerolineae bacterium]|nr:terpene cyclase/mutase family protein [Anaerolineae bacterium]
MTLDTALFKHDPCPVLLNSRFAAIRSQAGFLNSHPDVDVALEMAHLPEVRKIIQKQSVDGSWKYPGGGREDHRAVEDYDQIETFRMLGIMVQKFRQDRRNTAVANAAEFLFSRQSEQGDLRGIYGNQYTPNYTGALLALLVDAGYGEDPRALKVFDWLLQIRQSDGGWAIPMLTAGYNFEFETLAAAPLEPDHKKPFSHMVTGMVLRAFAAHPRLRLTPEAQQAGDLLAGRLFQEDAYSGRNTVDFWLRFSFPFWFTDLLSALDSLALLGYPSDHPQVMAGLNWFREQQGADGLWRLQLLRGGGKKRLNEQNEWISLRICQVFDRFHKNDQGVSDADDR